MLIFSAATRVICHARKEFAVVPGSKPHCPTFLVMHKNIAMRHSCEGLPLFPRMPSPEPASLLTGHMSTITSTVPQ